MRLLISFFSVLRWRVFLLLLFSSKKGYFLLELVLRLDGRLDDL
jgi:hypothetical protein